MKKNSLTIIALTVVLMIACGKNEKNANQVIKMEKKINTEIPYRLARNYFVKNDFKDGNLQCLKVTKQADFDKIFGMATTMGENGKPSEIDFAKQYVIALVGPLSNKMALLKITKLNKMNNEIEVNYEQKDGPSQSYISRPVDIIIVDNLYQGELKLVRIKVAGGN